MLFGSDRIERRARELIALADERRASQAQLSQDRLLVEARSARVCALEPRLPTEEQASSIEEKVSPQLSRDKQVSPVETSQSAGVLHDTEVGTLQQRRTGALFPQASAPEKRKEASGSECRPREIRMAEVEHEKMVSWRRALLACTSCLHMRLD
jgi:hypothetical protein